MGKRKRKKTKKIISNIKEMQTLGLISAVNTVMCLFPHKSGSIFCCFFLNISLDLKQQMQFVECDVLVYNVVFSVCAAD